jgi:hypothetical protein
LLSKNPNSRKNPAFKFFNCMSCFYFPCHSNFLCFSFHPFMVIKSFSLLQVYTYITSISFFNLQVVLFLHHSPTKTNKKMLRH